MKTLERQFFRYCIRQLDYNALSEDKLVLRVDMKIIAKEFSVKKNCNYGQLLYYLGKWASYGMYEYEISLDLGWFNGIHTFPSRYISIIPERVISKLKRALKRIQNTKNK